MNTRINKWIKQNCQQESTKQKLEFTTLTNGKTITVYLKEDYNGYLTDDIEGLLNNDCAWEALGDDLYLSNDKMEVGIINTPITNQVLF